MSKLKYNKEFEYKGESYKYFETGNENQPTLLYLYGLLGNIHNWQHTIKEFSDEYRQILPFLPVKEIDLDELVDYTRVFIDKTTKPEEEISIVGNSLGGHMAMLYTLKEPEKVNDLVLPGTSGLIEDFAFGQSAKEIHDAVVKQDYETLNKEIAKAAFKEGYNVPKDIIDDLLLSFGADPDKPFPEDLQEQYIGYRPSSPVWVNFRKYHKFSKSSEEMILSDEDLNSIKQPTLLVFGKEDKITPPEIADQFKDKIPNSTLEFVEDCGHAPEIEQAEEFNAIMRRFLERIK